PFTYDTRGDRTTSTTAGVTTSYGFDLARRLTSFTQGSTSTTYAYNGDGLRTSKTVNGTTTNFMWDVADGLPLVLTDGSNAYVYGPDGRPLEQINGSSAVFFHQDQLGSTRALTDATGTVVATYSYDNYGNTTGTTGTATTPLQ